MLDTVNEELCDVIAELRWDDLFSEQEIIDWYNYLSARKKEGAEKIVIRFLVEYKESFRDTMPLPLYFWAVFQVSPEDGTPDTVEFYLPNNIEAYLEAPPTVEGQTWYEPPRPFDVVESMFDYASEK